jgi:hypothetical protein
MATNILIRRSSTAGAIPTTAQLTTGELAINLADKKIYTNTGSSIIELGTIASTMDVEGALGVDGNFDVNTNKFTVAFATGNTSIAGTLDVAGNSQVDGDFTVLGAISIEEPTANSHAATKFYVDQAVTDLIGTAGSALDTLGELADALNDDANFASTVTTALATKLNLAGGTMTGNIVMGANKVTSTATPTAADDLTRKGYIDALYGSTASAAASATAAETAETNAETARDAAQTAQAAAETAETNAAASASSASTSATNAGNSASAASTSASSASTSASSASTSASNAATSATNAENAYDNFDDRYLGAKATDPTVDNDGDALITGAMYFDSSNNVMKVYSGTEWQNASSSIEGIKSDFVYTATASQVLFSGADDNTDTLVIDKAGLVNVYLNGVRLTDADYTIDASGNSVTLDSGATVGDIVEIEVFGNFAGQSGADVAITGGSITGLTELSTGTFTSTGIDDNATSTAITIDASGNVGIGGTPNEKLSIHTGSNNGGLRLDSSSGNYPFITFTENGAASCYLGDAGGFGGTSTNAGIRAPLGAIEFRTGSSERARIDSSGNLLVGKTSTSYNTAGIVAYNNGGFTATKSGDAPVGLNRLTNDGDILTFAKDGSTVGSIGASGGDLLIGSTTTGIIFTDSVEAIIPRSPSSGLVTDTTSLGWTNQRFKDLYLSGGVYLGGTGAANKLDDYEEGTFTADITPTGGSVTLSASNLRYVKIGSSVTVGGRLTVSSVSSPTGAIQITLPFRADLYSLYTGFNVGVENSASKTYNDFTGLVFSGTSTFRVYLADSNGLSSSAANAQQLQATTNIDLSFTYMTNS